MAEYEHTSKYELPILKGSNPIDLIDTGFHDLATKVDETFSGFAQGTLAFRPTSTAEVPGKTGRFYYATDTKSLYYDTGTSWVVAGSLVFATTSASTFSIKANEEVACAKTSTVTLPILTLGTEVGVIAELGFDSGEAVTVNTQGGTMIAGDFVVGAESLILLPGQHLRLRGTLTYWRIVAGEPKQIQEYSATDEGHVVGTEYTPSAVRPAEVLITLALEAPASAEVFVTGLHIADAVTGSTEVEITRQVIPVRCWPGQKWKVVGSGGVTIERVATMLY